MERRLLLELQLLMLILSCLTQKKEQFWNASKLLTIRQFKPLRLSLRIKSSLWYFEDGISKSSGLRDSGCNMETVKSCKLSIKAYRMCKVAVHISMIHKFMSVVLITSSCNRVHRNALVLPKWPCFSGVITVAFRIWTSKL